MIRRFILTTAILGLISFLLGCTNKNTVTDIDGNVYQTVVIGKQVWMAENLRVTHFRNGDLIPQIKENDQWKHYPVSAYSNYNNGDTVRNNYGFLYNWFAVTDSRNVAPEGWHVPTIDEIKELAEYLGTEAEAGGKLKESGFEHWLPPNTGATNEVGFSALPGGYRSGNDGKFHTRGSNAYWWAKTESYHLLAWTKLLHWNFADVNRSYDYKTYGFSVRCIKDNQ